MLEPTVEPVITIARAAREAGMTTNGMRYHLERGRVETQQTPLGRVVVRKSLEQFLEGREIGHKEAVSR